MSAVWDDYVNLLEEAAALPDQEARAVAEAKAAYENEGRRLSNDLALAERDVADLKQRNTRLQVGVRDLLRSTGVTLDPDAVLPPLPAGQVTEAMKALEYDLEQVRQRRQRLAAMRQTTPAPRPAAAVVPASVSVTPPTTPTSPAEGGVSPLVIGAIAALVVVLLIVIVLVIL
ncbi:MAG: hypothetical protein QM597_08920 [Aeromicrobium sp.]|uniref:hypothetical protein n=1 Tax=Aeromicrobium sp. TaxID=1871063 RepID=UPI0039E61691